ncbi:putative metal ion transporter [Wickerhamomyces ciferrii]|uniref:Metal ion transporter n=1 Tax=Wickerhamomyces ciferrii (strain ATCC 14091 / BCRC 22168 / CBS 111 / JCM 3599 / NBRC 0793 / NRRL Y-1031 F-60-10) TaxID=1206466 RepID=K0KSA8_WICCF|nr:putative metal ion transporter [Wickerhamomyces ciferrii]CCH44214.1 putative metal ion transporter [Wickerhamomyces ciferrii]
MLNSDYLLSGDASADLNYDSIYDSGDPNLPNLPHELSDYSEEDEEFTDLESLTGEHQKRRPSQYLFDNEVSQAQPPPTAHIPPASSQSTTTEKSELESNQNPQKSQSKKRHNRHKRKNRKYSDSAYSSTAAKKRISWEPGIDIHTTNVVMNSIGSSITVTDYRSDRYRVEHCEVFSNILNSVEVDTDSDFYLNKNDSMEYDLKSKQSVSKFKKIVESRPNWSKVRWINVNGLSWEAIATLGEKYELHRLSIEDMIDIPQRTKVDIYKSHLFSVLPVIKLVKSKHYGSNSDDSIWDKILKKLNLFDYLEEEQELKDDANYGVSDTRQQSLSERITTSNESRRLNETIVAQSSLSKRRHRLLDDQRPLSYRNLFVGVEQCSIFLTKDNTVISFFESSGDDIGNAILSRISTDETILRTSCDSSILVQSIIDSIVDIVYPVITAYKKRLSELELDVLTDSNMSHITTLHLMSGELSKLRSSILPTTVLINSLKDQAKKQNSEKKDISIQPSSSSSSPNLVSSVAELYLTDVSDHTQMYTDEIEGMINSIENLIGLIFNTTSNESNSAMQQLSLVTVIFLPLSFWTGYYGMNFESFGDLQNNVSYYWKIAIPFSCGLLILITWSFIKKTIVETKRKTKRMIQDININRDFKKRQNRKKQRRESRSRRTSTLETTDKMV